MEIKIFAYQGFDSYHLKRFRMEFKGDLLSGSNFDLFYRFKDGYVYILNYGVVVLANLNDIERTEFIRLLANYGETPLKTTYLEDYTIIQGDRLHFDHNSLVVTEIDNEIIRVCMLQVGQSTVLDYYYEKASETLAETYSITSELERKGKFSIGKRTLLKTIGKALNTHNRIIDDLYILDAPPATWDNELLEKVNNGLAKTFDIRNRYREMDTMLKSAQNNIELFIQLLDTRESKTLEIIIIVLIAIEVIPFVANLLKGFF